MHRNDKFRKIEAIQEALDAQKDNWKRPEKKTCCGF
jgi:hypothetical protein